MLLAATLLAACTAGDAGEVDPPTDVTVAPEQPAEVVPTDDWERTDAEEAGFDPDRLAAMDDALQEADSSCFVVTRGGKVVHEAYFGDADELTMKAAFSVTKSFTSVLVGIAADEGLLALDDPAAEHVPQWQGTDAGEVTIRDLLANVSGREWDYETDYEEMAFAAEDKTGFAIDLEQTSAPGEVWHYNNAAIQVLSAVLESTVGESPADYAFRSLLAPLQMTRTLWGGDDSGRTTTFSGVTASCLDLARLGLLMMRDGRWGDQQVLSPEHVAASTGEASSDLNASYGLLWWVNDEGPLLGPLTARNDGSDPARNGRLAPRAPDDAFWAIGFGGQTVAVVPSEDLVAVRMGAMPADEDAVSPDTFTGDLLDALR